MKKILGIVLMLSLVCAVMAQEVKPGKTEIIDLGKKVMLEMTLIPAGRFVMGDIRKEEVEKQEMVKKVILFESILKENPKKVFGKEELDMIEQIKAQIETEYNRSKSTHEVTLTKPFYIGKYEVTQEQWENVMGDNPSEIKGAKLPVTDISWNDCQDFIKKLNAKTNGGYRLPTEAEWEYSCRAGTTTAYSFGDEFITKDANYSDSNIGKPVAVGCYKPNAFGLYDMHGNVWEWCEDMPGVYSEGALTDPKRSATGVGHILRGGSFLNHSSRACSFDSTEFGSNFQYKTTGFRLVRAQ
jgi:formylglycine-generating enzyme required for sulfatase activity